MKLSISIPQQLHSCLVSFWKQSETVVVKIANFSYPTCIWYSFLSFIKIFSVRKLQSECYHGTEFGWFDSQHIKCDIWMDVHFVTAYNECSLSMYALCGKNCITFIGEQDFKLYCSKQHCCTILCSQLLWKASVRICIQTSQFFFLNIFLGANIMHQSTS